MQNEAYAHTNPPIDTEGRDNELWQIAKRRAGFKISAFSYVAVNSLLIVIWYLTSGPYGYFWPMWPLLGWGIGIITQYFHAYHATHLFSVENEYQKLKNKQL